MFAFNGNKRQVVERRDRKKDMLTLLIMVYMIKPKSKNGIFSSISFQPCSENIFFIGLSIDGFHTISIDQSLTWFRGLGE